MVAPLALIGLVLGRKKKRGKWDTFIALLVVCVVVGMSVSACNLNNPAEPTADPIEEAQKAIDAQVTVLVEATKNAESTQAALATTDPGITITVIFTAAETPEPPCDVTPTAGVEAKTNQEMFLDAVLAHKDDLPPGFSVALLLAMGAAESGELFGWSNEIHGGVLQLRKDSAK